MRVKVHFHDNCFDGLASAALFSDFHRSVIDRSAEFIYEGLVHRAGQLFLDVSFDGEENAIVDFKYSNDPRLTWWFDHHQSAFLSKTDEEHFRGDRSGRKFHDPTYRSCTSFIADMTRTHFGFDNRHLQQLIRWADIIDGAQFADAHAAVELREPALKLMMVIEGIREPGLVHRLISDFQKLGLDEIAAEGWVNEAFQPLWERHLQSIDIIQRYAEYLDGAVFFDVSDYELEGYNKFIPYYLYPEATYCVGVSLSSFRSKISVGSNPWSRYPRRHNLAALCERFGGGGHPVVGAISFPPEDLPRAREIARDIVRELRAEPDSNGLP